MPPPPRLQAALTDRYRLERELGQGGMATVYLAHDLKHDRQVAIKVLRPELAAVIGAERFLSEIKTTANLQHPHILPLFDSGVVDGTVFYAMPFVEGESLRDRLQRETQLPIADAVRIASEVAGALDYAHRKGVIHRDIKPENILLHDGRALVADFGIALAATSADARMTETGMSLGTPQYMSPEQAMGERTLDARTDVYALGCVLFELLTGEPPFTGPTAQSIVAKVLTAEPEAVSLFRKTVPPHVAAAVAQAIEKLPADRFESAAAFALALQDRTFRSGAIDTPDAVRPRWTGTQLAIGAGAVAIALVAGVLLGRGSDGTASAAQFVVSELVPPDGQDLSDRRSFGALSPDGRTMAFVLVSASGERQLWLRRLDALTAEPLPGTERAQSPFWSPDGRSIAFFADGRLMRIDLGASAPRRICDAPGATAGSWGKDDLIVFATPRGIERVVNGTCDIAIPLDSAARTYRTPSLLGDGHTVLFTRRETAAMDNGAFGGSLVRGDLETGEFSLVVPAALAPTFVPPNLLVYGRAVPGGFSLVGQRLRADASGVEGEPVVLSGPIRDTDLELSYTVSASGSLVYYPTLGNREKLLVDRRGVIVDTLRQRGTWTFAAAHAHPWVALAGSWNLWLYDLDRGVSTPLLQTDGNMLVANPVWSPTDSALAFGACQIATLDDIEQPTRVPVDDCVRATDWSPDGRHLVLEVGEASFVSYAAQRSVVALEVATGTVRPLFDVSGATSEATVSPDGTLIAYTSWDTGDPEIYVRPFLATGRVVRVTTGGARSPQWAKSGRDLHYQTADGQIMVTSVNGASSDASTAPRMLFRADGYSRTMLFDRGTSFDLSPDGEHFILRLRETAGQAVLVQHWTSLLEGR